MSKETDILDKKLSPDELDFFGDKLGNLTAAMREYARETNIEKDKEIVDLKRDILSGLKKEGEQAKEIERLKELIKSFDPLKMSDEWQQHKIACNF